MKKQIKWWAPALLLPLLAGMNFLVLKTKSEEANLDPPSGIVASLPEPKEATIDGKFEAFQRVYRNGGDQTFIQELDQKETAIPQHSSRYTEQEQMQLDSLEVVWQEALNPPRRTMPVRTYERVATAASHQQGVKIKEDTLRSEVNDSVNLAIKEEPLAPAVFFSGNSGSPGVFHSQEKAMPFPQGIILQDTWVQQGDRLMLQLTTRLPLDEGSVAPVGTIVYAQVQAFSTDRLQLLVNSIYMNGVVYPIELRIRDIDGGEGLHVPQGNFIEIRKEAESSLLQSFPTISSGGDPSLFQDLAQSMIQNSVRTSSRVLAKAARKNKALIKAGTILYLTPY